MGEWICSHASRLSELLTFVTVYKGLPITVRFPGPYFFLPCRKCMDFHYFCKVRGCHFFDRLWLASYLPSARHVIWFFWAGPATSKWPKSRDHNLFPYRNDFSWTSRGSNFGAGKTTSWAIWTDSAPNGATRKSHCYELFSILARFPISSLNFRQCHSLVFPREKLILRQIVTTWKLSFLTSSGYSNAKWKNHKIFYFYKSWNSTSFDKRPGAVIFHRETGSKRIR